MMKMILEGSTGKSQTFILPLNRTEESKLMQTIDDKKDAILAYNLIAGLLGIARIEN